MKKDNRTKPDKTRLYKKKSFLEDKIHHKGIIGKRDDQYFLKSINKKQRFSILLLSLEKGAEVGDFVEVLIKDKKHKGKRSQDKYFTASIVNVIKKNVPSIQKLLSFLTLHDHNIDPYFSDDILESVKKRHPILSSNREDWTDIPFLTIDPKTARDHDDAVAAFEDTDSDNKDGFIIYVAIADVVHYVDINSLLDLEARKRGNSTYLPDMVVPMLPEYLSANMCSLKQKEKRAVLGLKLIFDSQGKKKHHKFCRAIIKCMANLSYEQAADLQNNVNDPALDVFKDITKPLFHAYKILKTARQKKAPLALNFPEYEINMTEEGDVDSITKKMPLETHKLIEELMVLSNIAAAETLEKADIPLIYRTHENPPADKISALKDSLKKMNIPFAKGQIVTPNMFNDVLKKAEGTEYQDMVSKLILRCQCQAIYSPKNEGHYGLNLVKYAHFTSPIRRYADLCVHRALIQSIEKNKESLDGQALALDELSDISNHISQTERKAMKIEMEAKDRYMASYMEKYIGNLFLSTISGISRAGIFVKINDIGAEGFIPNESLSVKVKRYFIYDEKNNMVKDRYSGDYYILGQSLEVKLLEAVPISGGMRFGLVHEKQLRPSLDRKAQKKKKTEKKIDKKPKRNFRKKKEK